MHAFNQTIGIAVPQVTLDEKSQVGHHESDNPTLPEHSMSFLEKPCRRQWCQVLEHVGRVDDVEGLTAKW